MFKDRKFKLDESGLKAAFTPWELSVLDYLWLASPNMDFNSREIHEAIQTRTPISRASVINFLKAMKDEGIITGKDVTGKGGHHDRYSALMTRDALKLVLAECLREKASELHE